MQTDHNRSISPLTNNVSGMYIHVIHVDEYCYSKTMGVRHVLPGHLSTYIHITARFWGTMPMFRVTSIYTCNCFEHEVLMLPLLQPPHPFNVQFACVPSPPPLPSSPPGPASVPASVPVRMEYSNVDSIEAPNSVPAPSLALTRSISPRQAAISQGGVGQNVSPLSQSSGTSNKVPPIQGGPPASSLAAAVSSSPSLTNLFSLTNSTVASVPSLVGDKGQLGLGQLGQSLGQEGQNLGQGGQLGQVINISGHVNATVTSSSGIVSSITSTPPSFLNTSQGTTSYSMGGTAPNSVAMSGTTNTTPAANVGGVASGMFSEQNPTTFPMGAPNQNQSARRTPDLKAAM